MLRFLLDEHLRGPLFSTILRHNLWGGLSIDVICVGDLVELPLGADDNHILAWAEEQDRILITKDKHTMPGHLAEHLNAGHRSPGVLMLRGSCSLRDVLDCLELIAHAGEAFDYANAIVFIP